VRARVAAPRSLAARLLISATAWSAVALVVAGFILVALYRQSVERAFDARLDVLLKSLVAALVGDDAGARDLREPGSLGEPRFGLPLSGWYWVVRAEPSGDVELASQSLAGDDLAVSGVAARDDGDLVGRGTATGPDDEFLRYVERPITLADGRHYSVLVAGDANEIAADVATFGTRVAATLGVFGLGLLLATALQVRIALRPLARLREALNRIRTGEAARLEGAFPSELQPVAEELNAVVDANREVVERARTHVGNLAHALKTPLSVILNEARGHPGLPPALRIAEQAEVMNRQIAHHLERARAAAQRRIIGIVTEVEPVMSRLVRVMAKIHEDRALELTLFVEPGLAFRGERDDLEEIAGNLLDNACKWASGRVAVGVRSLPVEGSGRRWFVLRVEDDGLGLAPERREEAMQRGRRLDESVPGSGLGLSIVAELAQLYGGGLDLASSPLGGLAAEVRLPAMERPVQRRSLSRRAIGMGSEDVTRP